MLAKQAILSVLSWVVIVETIVLFDAMPTIFAKEPPTVRFDASCEIPCRAVAAPGTTVDAGSKLIEARFRVSILVEKGSPADVEDVLVRIESPQRRLRVVDFSPKTELANTLEGDVQTTRTSEKTATLGAQVGGTPIPFGNLGSVQLGSTQHQVVAQTIKELPSKCQVLASGTLDAEHGLFFKLKAAPQVPLEGAKEFTCTFEVPKGWRGGWCLLSCHARGIVERYMGKSVEPCGCAETFVGLYLEGDRQVEAIAGQLDNLRLPQPISAADRQALGLPIEPDHDSSEVGRHRSFEVGATLTGWTRLSGLMEHGRTGDANLPVQLTLALQETLNALSLITDQ